MPTEFTVVELERIADVRALLRSGDAARLREAAGLRRSEFAAVVPCHASTLMRWEEGHRTPRPRAAMRLAEAYLGLLGRLTQGLD